MTLPDFVIVGAMKGGTSTLQAQLAAQPGVFMSTPKEPNYFSDDAVFARGESWYRGLFAAARPGDLKGEASTHYTKLPTHPHSLARMQALLPAPRLIYLIRDPVARAVSHYIHGWSEGDITLDVEAAFERHPELVEYGRYAMQIAPFLAAYGADRVHLATLERMTAAPQAVLTEIGQFLGLATDPVWQADLGRQNVSAERFRPLPMQRLLVDNPLARGLRRALVPKALRARIRQSRSLTVRPELSPALRERLHRVYEQDRDQLARLFPGHPALTEAYPFLPPAAPS